MRDLWAESTVHICQVEGCNALAPYGRYCLNCQTEIEALDSWALRQKMKRARRAEQFCAAVAWVRRWLWVPMLSMVALALFYLGLAFGAVFIEWIRE